MERQIGALDTPFGLAAVGADALDVQFVENPAELGMAVAGGGLLAVDPEHAVLVALEGPRLAVQLQIVPRGFEVTEG